MTTTPVPQTDLRARAIRHLKKKRDLQGHVLVYVLVNSCLVMIWAITTAGGFFWPVFPMAFWGVGLVMHTWDVFFKKPVTDADVEAELERERRT